MSAVDKILKILNNSNFWSLVSIIVVAITSYTVAKYNASKPNKLKIKQLQLDNVYLPLFRLFERLPKTITREYAVLLQEETAIILDDYYELAFPQLHKLNRKLKHNINHSENRTQLIYRMKHQIIMDYELLKKSLGYPSESLLRLFIRMPNKRKFGIVMLLFVMIFIVFTLGSTIYSSIFVYKRMLFHPSNIVYVVMIIFYIHQCLAIVRKLLKN